MKMKTSDIVAGIAGLAAGESIADTLVDDDNILGHVATGLIGATIVGGVTKTVLRETGIDNLLDDIFGF